MWEFIMFLSIIIGVISFILISATDEDSSVPIIIVLILLVLFSVTGIVTSYHELNKTKIYKDAIFNNPYDYKIRYEIIDSIALPVDTIYFLKKEI